MNKIINVLLAVTLILSTNLKAEAITAAVVAGGKITASTLANVTVKDLLQDARDEAQALLSEAENTSNVLLVRAADQLNLSADNIIRQLDGRLDKTFQQVDQTTKEMLLGLANATSTASVLMEQAYTFKDTLALDTRSILGDIPFVKERLVLQRVTGLSSIVGRPEYEITLIGSYLGLPGEGHRSEISINVGGTEITDFRTEPTQIHVNKLVIPESALIQSVQSDSVTHIPLTFNIKQTFDKKVWGFLWNTEVVKTYSSTVIMTIYPRYAGQLETVARHIQYGWVGDEPIARSMTHEAHCSKKCSDWYGRVYSVHIDVNGNRANQTVEDRRIAGDPTCKKTAGTNGFSVSHGVVVSPDKSKATCTIRFRTRQQTYTMTANTERYQITDELDTSYFTPVYFGKTVEVRVPKATKLIILKSKLITGEEISLIDTEVDASSPIQIVKTIDNVNDKSIFISVKDPTL